MQYIPLYLSYGLTSILVLLLVSKTPFWNINLDVEFKKPWREFTYTLLSCFGIIILGQLYTAGIRLNSSNTFYESINQLLIFSPALLLIALRHKNTVSVWIEFEKAHWKILTGIGLAVSAIFIYSRIGSDKTFLEIITETYSLKNFDYLVQVLCEDIVIAMLFIRLKAATSLKTGLITVSLLFALGHAPAMLAKGFPLEEFYSLFLDAGLGVFMIYTIYRTKDILWFWMVHFAMDMMQFYA